MKKVIAAICASFMMIGPAFAAPPPKTATVTVQVKAQVVGNCDVTANGAMDFGTYDGSAKKDANTVITISCSQNRTVGIDVTSANSFLLKGTGTNTDTLGYSLYSTNPSPGPGLAWAPLTGIAVDKVNGATQTIYGEIATGLNVADDQYTDTLTVTVTY